jgi:hypothetical protein
MFLAAQDSQSSLVALIIVDWRALACTRLNLSDLTLWVE